jgi:DNA-binding NarL/FixJ family response regulator
MEFFIMTRLLLVDDQELVCQGLRAMLNLEPDIQVVGVANNGQVAIQQVEALQPDVILMDIRMPVMDGREATRIICQRFPEIKVLVVSTFDEDDYIAHSIKAGAKGYLLKDMPVEELAQAIRLVDRGYSQMGPGLMEKMFDGMVSDQNDIETERPELVELTAREIDVLNLIGSGCTNREIAQQLYIAEGTVKSHVTHILNRLNLRNRSQIAIYANSVKQTSLPTAK